MSASLTGIWEIDTTTGKVYLDAFSHTIFGLQPSNFDGKYTSLMRFIDAAHHEAMDFALRTAIVREKDFNIEFSIHTPDGKHEHLNAKGQIIYEEDVNKRFNGTITDITEKKKRLEIETRY